MLTMVAAIKEETSGIKRRIHIDRTVVRNGYRIFHGDYKGKEALLVETGVGKERAEKAISYVFENYPVTILVSFGFAGALIQKAKIGDLYLCSTIHGEDLQKDKSYLSDLNLTSQCLKAIPEKQMTIYEGNLVTIDKPVTEPAAKQALNKASSCNVADMESYWIALIADQKHVPLVSVRAISDTADERLPPFNDMIDSQGKLLWRQTISYFVSHPGKMLSLYRNSRTAMNNLTEYIDILAERLQ